MEKRIPFFKINLLCSLWKECYVICLEPNYELRRKLHGYACIPHFHQLEEQ